MVIHDLRPAFYIEQYADAVFLGPRRGVHGDFRDDSPPLRRKVHAAVPEKSNCKKPEAVIYGSVNNGFWLLRVHGDGEGSMESGHCEIKRKQPHIPGTNCAEK
eukprot:3087444-Rhodomonas_salina.1